MFGRGGNIRFRDRDQAGSQLGAALQHHARVPGAIVLGLPRGGVVTAARVAAALELPLDVLVVRKLGTPGQEELAMGAIGPGGVRVLNDEVLRAIHLSQERIEAAAEREQREVIRREQMFRGVRPPLALADRIVILVDDGLATGSTMAAAIRWVRSQKPARVVLAVPVAPLQTCQQLGGEVDELVCLATPEPFYAVGQWYEDFDQVSDERVIALLDGATKAREAHSTR
jgi:putative phosphoribosyl transferase